MYRNGMRGDRFRQGSWILETLNLVFSIITILLGIFILLNINTMKQWLAVLFLAGASVNLLNSMQSFYYGKRVRGMGFLITSFLIFAFGVASYITLWV